MLPRRYEDRLGDVGNLCGAVARDRCRAGRCQSAPVARSRILATRDATGIGGPARLLYGSACLYRAPRMVCTRCGREPGENLSSVTIGCPTGFQGGRALEIGRA
jgi:hypothetical protein